MTVCSICNSIDGNSIKDICRDCEAEIEDLADDDDDSCPECCATAQTILRASARCAVALACANNAPIQVTGSQDGHTTDQVTSGDTA